MITQAIIDRVNNDVKDAELYVEHGYNSRYEYLESLSDDHGIPIELVVELAETLGPDEDFDALSIACQDYDG